MIPADPLRKSFKRYFEFPTLRAFTYISGQSIVKIVSAIGYF